MSSFCPEEAPGKRCVLYKNHVGPCSLQGKTSATVRQIERQEEKIKKLEEH